LLTVVAGVLGAFALVGTAQAAAPVTFTLPGTDTAGGNGYCPFAVSVTYTNNQQARPGPNGITTGNATATVSANGKTLTYNVSGPSKATYFPDGNLHTAVAGGPNLLYTTVDSSYSGVPQLAYSTGHVQFSLTDAAPPSGVTTAYSLNGSRTDVCAALAP
jgi:hypothetical protein